MPLKSESKSVVPQCRIVVFPWKFETVKEELSFSDLAQSNPIEVSAELINCNFDKSMSNAAGNFSFTLANTRDWKQVLRPGQWCLIYMTNDGDLAPPKTCGKEPNTVSVDLLKGFRNRLRGICYIDRVAAKGDMTDAGALEVSFEVSGRDFGIVYEETTIWHNFFQFESGIIDAAVASLAEGEVKTVDGLLKTIHRLFYAPWTFPPLASRDPSDPKSLSQVGFQWLLPREMLEALSLKLTTAVHGPFYGAIQGLLNFMPTKATFPIENPMSTLNGNAWEKLKAHSIQQFHELYPELDDDGAPRLNFRPIPWKIDGRYYPNLDSFIPSFRSLADAGVKLNPIDILSFDFGEDNHSRYNHFYTTIQSSSYNANDSITELDYPSAAGRKFPHAQVKSIARHGFRPMHVEVNALMQLGLYSDGKADQKLLVEFNELIYDFWNNAIFFESGTANIIGRNDIRIGKAVVFSADTPYNANKAFYVEGYTDEFHVEESGATSWTQSLKLTRGAELDVVDNLLKGVASDFNKRIRTFNETGDFTGRG